MSCVVVDTSCVSFPLETTRETGLVKRTPACSQLQLCLKLHTIPLILNVVFLGRVSSMASAPTSKYNSHSLENESIKRVS